VHTVLRVDLQPRIAAIPVAHYFVDPGGAIALLGCIVSVIAYSGPVRSLIHSESLNIIHRNSPALFLLRAATCPLRTNYAEMEKLGEEPIENGCVIER
jgi:hypothetical protein